MASDEVAIIVGSAGQDGRLLADLLASRGQQVIGVTRHTLDITDGPAVDRFVAEHPPTHIYYLPADHGSSARGSTNRSTDADLSNTAAAASRAWATHVTGLVHFCEAMRRHRPAARLFYASSSRIYGDADTAPTDTDGVRFVDETTPRRPTDLYGITKAAGMSVCEMYRRQDLFCSAGILFNHESPLRGETFITQRLARGAAEAMINPRVTLSVGRLCARTDWGWAAEYVDAMTRILAIDEPADFVIATGVPHRVQDFAEAAYGSVKLDWRDHVREDPSLVGPARSPLAGNYRKLHAACGWRPGKTLTDIAAALVQAQVAAAAGGPVGR